MLSKLDGVPGKQEAARHEAIVKNMHRLKALRLAREAELKNQ
jgi:hypothetical protein